MTTKNLSNRLARWRLKLQAFTFTIHHRRASLNLVPDCLSRQFNVSSLLLENIDFADIPAFTVDFSDPAFKSPDYQDLKSYILDNQEQLPDLMISDL